MRMAAAAHGLGPSRHVQVATSGTDQSGRHVGARRRRRRQESSSTQTRPARTAERDRVTISRTRGRAGLSSYFHGFRSAWSVVCVCACAVADARWRQPLRASMWRVAWAGAHPMPRAPRSCVGQCALCGAWCPCRTSGAPAERARARPSCLVTDPVWFNCPPAPYADPRTASSGAIEMCSVFNNTR